MAFLTLNGVAVKCSAESGERSVSSVGGSGRSFGGTWRSGERARKREWRFRTVPLALSEVPAWEGLITGKGQHWPLNEGFYSDAGLAAGVVPGVGLYGFSSALSSPHSPHLYMYGFPSAVAWTLGPFSDYTLISSFHQFPEGSGSLAWERQVLTSDGGRFRNGAAATLDARWLGTVDGVSGQLWIVSREFGCTSWAPSTDYAPGAKVRSSSGDYVEEAVQGGRSNESAPAWSATKGSTTQDGGVIWRNEGNIYTRVSDAAWLPYRVPAAWVPQMDAFYSARPWSPLPSLLAQGDFAPDAAAGVLVRGEVTGAQLVRWRSGGAWVSGEALDFTLREV
jgi:hypothetical protein